MPTDEAQRASPDALLALAKKEGRGHLKIFLGAAPGVGKTFAMLLDSTNHWNLWSRRSGLCLSPGRQGGPGIRVPGLLF